MQDSTPYENTGHSAWPWAGALLLAVAWMLPNHYLPWATFHAEALSALTCLLFGAGVLARARQHARWTPVGVLMAALLPVPVLQYAAGLIAWGGHAWLVSLYLLGLWLSYQVGRLWQQQQAGQMLDALMRAVLIAGVLSVYLQLRTLLQVENSGLWTWLAMGQDKPRPWANVGQPNQLATMLLWAVLGCVWGYKQGWFKAWLAVPLAGGLLYGVSLTQSRSAWLGLTLILLWFWWRARREGRKTEALVATGLYLLFWLYPLVTGALVHALVASGEGAGAASFINGISAQEGRLKLYPLFWLASWQQPGLGHGWQGLASVLIETAAQRGVWLGSLADHTHNLLLDLVVWMGWPMGLLVAAVLFIWLARQVRVARTADMDSQLRLLALLVLGIHAMLELPHHYAFFLLPAGLLMGSLDAGPAAPQEIGSPWSVRWLWLPWAFAALALGLLTRDYLRVEESVRMHRMELAGIVKPGLGKEPEVVLLSQWPEIMRLMRYKPHVNTSVTELEWLEKTVRSYPRPGTLYTLALSKALNGQPEQAGQWLSKICVITLRPACAAMKADWQQLAQRVPALGAVKLPD